LLLKWRFVFFLGACVTSAAEAEAEGRRGQDLWHEEQKGRESLAHDRMIVLITSRNCQSLYQHPLMLFTGRESAAVR
jgi:hypothetical protein